MFIKQCCLTFKWWPQLMGFLFQMSVVPSISTIIQRWSHSGPDTSAAFGVMVVIGQDSHSIGPLTCPHSECGMAFQCLSLFDPIKYLIQTKLLRPTNTWRPISVKIPELPSWKICQKEILSHAGHGLSKCWQEAGGCDWFSWRHFTPHPKVTLVRLCSHRVKSLNSQLT